MTPGFARLCCSSEKSRKSLGKRFGLFFRNKMARVGNHNGCDVLEIGLQCFSHRWN